MSQADDGDSLDSSFNYDSDADVHGQELSFEDDSDEEMQNDFVEVDDDYNDDDSVEVDYQNEEDGMDDYAYETSYVTTTDNESDDQVDEMGISNIDNSVNYPVLQLSNGRFSYVTQATCTCNLTDEDDNKVIFVSKEKDDQHTSGSSSTLSCAICLEPLKTKNKPVSTSCGHLFCCSCLNKAIDRTEKCPLCNTKQGKNTFHRIYF